MSQSIPNNNTVISWNLQLISTNYGRIDSSASKTWSVTVNGTNYSGTNTVGIANNATKTLAAGSTTISHNADGTKTFSFSFSQQFNINFNGYVGTISGSGTGVLNTIPRASSITANNGTLGTSNTLTINRASSAFMHTITWSCGMASGTVTTKTSNTSVAWDTSNGIRSIWRRRIRQAQAFRLNSQLPHIMDRQRSERVRKPYQWRSLQVLNRLLVL